MTLIEAYNAAVARNDINDDVQQRYVITALQRVADEIDAPVAKWFNWRRKKPVTGLYVHGPVGAGKTYLVDLFYACISESHKARFHFHHFMQQVDAQLRLLQGKKDPLKHIAANLAKTTRLLCLDEFLVHDVADAMILGELLNALFEQGIILVATTNTGPDDLYLNGVHRERFLPAIELIKSHCQILGLFETRDYRLGRTSSMQAYFYPLNETTHQLLHQQFDAIAPSAVKGGELTIQQRLVPCIQSSQHAVWFTFDVLCNIPRSQLDYLEIADRFDTVFVSDIPVLTPDDTVRAIMLIHLIDVMYDRGIHLVLSAADVASGLYRSGSMIKSFQRTLSRLEEMQSIDYLERHAHRNVSNF